MTSTDAVRHVAIIKPCCIGDCVMALPAIDAISAHFADASVDIFAGSHSRDVFLDRSRIASIRACPETFSAAAAIRFGRGPLRKPRYDTVVLLDRSRWLRIAADVSRASSKLQVTPQSPERRHESEVYLDVARSLNASATNQIPEIRPRSSFDAEARSLVDVNRRFAVLHPGGGQNPGAHMPGKRWPADRFTALTRWLRTQSIDVVLTGSPDERALASQIANESGLQEGAVVAGRANFMTTAAIISHAQLYVGGDTGMTHIAAAVNTPVVALFGPTNPGRYRPIGDAVRTICPPASWEIPDVDLRKRNPIPDAARIDHISVQQVIGACADLLDAQRGVRPTPS